MQITKEFRIGEVKATRASNAPFTLVLESAKQGKESFLTFDAKTCAQYNIPMSFDLIERTLICSFESHDIPLVEKRVWGQLKSDDLIIQALEKTETVYPMFAAVPPLLWSETSRTLKLATYGSSDGFHFHILPCPFYKIFVEITEEEHEACRQLPPATAFRVHFQLL